VGIDTLPQPSLYLIGTTRDIRCADLRLYASQPSSIRDHPLGPHFRSCSRFLLCAHPNNPSHFARCLRQRDALHILSHDSLVVFLVQSSVFITGEDVVHAAGLAFRVDFLAEVEGELG